MTEIHTTLFGIYTKVGTTRLLTGTASTDPIAIYSNPITSWNQNLKTTGTCIVNN